MGARRSFALVHLLGAGLARANLLYGGILYEVSDVAADGFGAFGSWVWGLDGGY